VTSDDGSGDSGFAVHLSQHLVNLVAGKQYKFSCRTRGVGRQSASYESTLLFNDFGSEEWQTRTAVFTAVGTPSLPLMLGAFGNSGESIGISFDDIVIVPV
jgi:hypothetical protein